MPGRPGHTLPSFTACVNKVFHLRKAFPSLRDARQDAESLPLTVKCRSEIAPSLFFTGPRDIGSLFPFCHLLSAGYLPMLVESLKMPTNLPNTMPDRLTLSQQLFE